jgi:ATP-binding cassette subfamily C protein
LINPADGSRRALDHALAARLEPAGHAFHRPFTDAAFSFWELLRFGARGLQKDFLLLCLMGVCGGILATLPAMAIGQIFDHIVPEAERLKLLQLTAGLVVLAVSAGIFDFIRGIASLRIEGRLDQELQSALIDRLLKLPVPFFRDYSSGDLAERAMSLNQIRLVASTTVVNAVLGNAFAGFNVVLLFYYDAKLAAAAVATLLVALGFTLAIGLVQLVDERQMAAVQGKLSGMVLQFLTGITKLRVAGAEPLAFSAWASQFARQKDLSFRARRLTNRLHVFNAAFPVLSSALIFHLVTRWSGANPLSTGDFLAFTAAFSGFGAPMMTMTAAALTALNVVPLFDRLRPLLQARPEVTDAKLDPGALSGGIELSHLSFRYRPDAPLVLQDVSLRARPGEFIAIVGPSGSGKSTLMRLLLGFDIPENGVIQFDGQNLAELDVAAVRRQIGVVMQSSKLMAGSILSNIAGSTLLTEEDAWRAARLAGLAEDIEAMPMGMHTVIPAGGGVLSGGQQQRLMIARAIVFQPRILLFDEATSALDNRTQAIVSVSLEKLQATRVVIAHRLSTIVNADRIFVLEAGRIVQNGTYQELLQQPGLFSDLARRQLLDVGELEGQTFLY